MKKHLCDISQLFGVLTAGIGAHSLLGYITGQEAMYRWYGQVGMAVNTAAAFLLTGTAIYFLGRALKHEPDKQT